MLSDKSKEDHPTSRAGAEQRDDEAQAASVEREENVAMTGDLLPNPKKLGLHQLLIKT